MAEVRDGDQPPHTESDPANAGATASIFETEAPGTAPSDGTMLVASDSFENIYEPIESIRPRLGSGIIDSMSGKKGKDDDENEEEIEEEEEEEEEEEIDKNLVLYEKDDDDDDDKEEDNKLQEDLRDDHQLPGLNDEVKDERISKGAEEEKDEEKEEKLMIMDENEVEKDEREKVEGNEEEANKPSNNDGVITTSTLSPPQTESLGTDPGSGSGTNIITHSTDSMSTSTASASTPGGDGSGGPALSAKKDDVDDDETRRSSVMSAELASSVEGLAVSADDAEGEETSSWMHTSTNTLSDGEDVNHPAWRNHKKHVFILSEAGKPVYSRFGNEDNLVTLMGLMQALVSFVSNSENDIIRCIVAGNHRFVFLIREHLILVGVSQGPDSAHQLLLQLSYVYNQIISVLTLSQLSKIFRQRRNFDLRRLLSGAEKFIDNLLNMMDSEPGFLLGAVRCLPLDGSIRDSIAQTICQHCKVKDLVFALIIASSQLVTLVRMKKYYLHPVDLHLIINLVNASESFKAAESWTPICLPKFDSSGFLQAHVSYLDESCQTCLFLLTVDRDSFFTLSECKSKIKQKLHKSNSLQAISDSLSRNSYSIKQCAISGLRHFLYKSRNSAQYTSPELEAPYLSQDEQERLFGLYQYLHHRIHSGCRPLKLLYHVGPHETLIGWITQGFELYAVFGPLVTKTIAIQAINKLLRWIKKEENRLFILSSFTF